MNFLTNIILVNHIGNIYYTNIHSPIGLHKAICILRRKNMLYKYFFFSELPLIFWKVAQHQVPGSWLLRIFISKRNQSYVEKWQIPWLAEQGKIQDEHGPCSGVWSKKVFKKYGAPLKGRRAPMAKEGRIWVTGRW